VMMGDERSPQRDGRLEPDSRDYQFRYV